MKALTNVPTLSKLSACSIFFLLCRSYFGEAQFNVGGEL